MAWRATLSDGGAWRTCGPGGRTDAGVHALCQVAHLRAARQVPPSLLKQSINDRLPSDINVREAREAHSRFHARHHAEERFYLYQIATERTAFGKHFVWWIRDRLKEIREVKETVLSRRDIEELEDCYAKHLELERSLPNR